MNGYKELVDEIEIHKHLMESFEISYKHYKRIGESWKPRELGAMVYSDMPKGSVDYTDLVAVMCKIAEFRNKMFEEKEIYEQLLDKKEFIDKCVDSSMDMRNKILLLNTLEIKQCKIAEMLNVTDRHVRRVLHKNKNNN